jgi:branched-subunit amino acid transport protein
MTVWLTIVAVGLGSYLFRLSMLTMIDRVQMPARFERASELVAPAAFAALATTSVAAVCLQTGAAQAAPPLAAVAAAVLAVLRTGSPHAAMLAGMPTLWLAGALVGA